jgi:hypothetical protein
MYAKRRQNDRKVEYLIGEMKHMMAIIIPSVALPT